MTPAFARAFAAVVVVEGGYTRDAADPGNWTGGAVGAGELRGTKYGISAAAYPTLDIAALTISVAAALYRPRYWDVIAGDALPWPVALIAFDCAVNQGPGIAARILQLALGVVADGVVGPVTIAAAARFARGPSPVVVEIAARRAVRYAAGDMAHFGLGWMRRLMTMTAKAVA
ncbi:MAG: hypothetical protein HIU82_02045 [Proteobacteria bacterium]|nr:hypothetical protein [Pseudomonadota bacterium]